MKSAGALGLRIPELVLVDVTDALGRNEPDAEIRHLLQSSIGINLALDYLPGSTMFNPAARDRADPHVASEAVWFDAFVTNVDRTLKNPNLLYWHKNLYLIDHGAALYFHHNWPADLPGLEKAAESVFNPDSRNTCFKVGERNRKSRRSARAPFESGALRGDSGKRARRLAPPRAWLPNPSRQARRVRCVSQPAAGSVCELCTGGAPCPN